MVVAAVILTAFFAIELATAITINSIALLANAGHLLTDLAALFMGVVAVMLARRGGTATDRRAPTAGIAPRCSPPWPTRCC